MVVPRGAQCVSAHEDTLLRPPEGDLLPPPRVPDDPELERRVRDRVARDDVTRHAEPARELGTVAVVTVEQLDDAGGLARGADPLLDSVARDRIDQPDAPVRDQRVRATLQELLDDPTEAAFELVAEADSHAGHTTGMP